MRRLFASVGLISLCALLFCPAALAEEPSPATSLSALLPAAGSGASSAVGQVKRVELGSKGATVTLTSGQNIQLDFGALAGVGGGPNYIGWGMVLFGGSVAARLLTSITRLFRPFGMGRRRRRD